MNYQEFAQSHLQKNGYKITRPRAVIISALDKSKNPYNPYELSSYLESCGEKVDTVTIYRVLELFLQLNLVHKVDNKYIACSEFSCTNHKHCHHQFICNQCKGVSEIHVNDASFIKKLSQSYPQISITEHRFQFSGLCKSCN